MNNFFLNPFIYAIAGIVLIVAWFARKGWIYLRSNRTQSLILEEDFIP